MQGKMGEAQEGGAGMQMGGAHAQHGMMMGAGGVRHGALSEAQNPQLMMAQQNLADHIRGGLETVSCVTGDLYSAAEIPVLGEDSVSDPTRHCTGVLALPVTLCEAARHCLVHRCPGSTSDPL